MARQVVAGADRIFRAQPCAFGKIEDPRIIAQNEIENAAERGRIARRRPEIARVHAGLPEKPVQKILVAGEIGKGHEGDGLRLFGFHACLCFAAFATLVGHCGGRIKAALAVWDMTAKKHEAEDDEAATILRAGGIEDIRRVLDLLDVIAEERLRLHGGDEQGAVMRLLVRQLLEGDGSGMPLLRLARQTGIPRETLRRKIGPLLNRGYLRQDADGRYHAGIAYFQDAASARERLVKTLRDLFGDAIR